MAETKTERRNMQDNRDSLWRKGYGIYEEPEAPSLDESWARFAALAKKCEADGVHQ